jgi:hypothetical protein
MGLYKAVARFLNAFVINFALAAHVVVREMHEVHVDVVPPSFVGPLICI